MDQIRLDGRTALVTGAGGGLGRAHALLLASRGAQVVVNDLGGARDGTGADPSMAEQVVKEIQQAGGQAVANHDSVATWKGGESIVATALEAFGRIDVVVNNAGILRDTSFTNLTEETLVPVLDVHLRGAFHVAHAAWPHMRAQGHGRIINTSSGSGLYGNFGQANYAAAKMGLIGLTRTLAVEGARYGVTANAVTPIAWSRLSEDVFPPEAEDLLAPEYVSSLVAWLASDACDETGCTWVAGGGHYARVAILEGHGIQFDRVPTPEELAARRKDLRSVEDGREWPEAGAQFLAMAKALGWPMAEQAT